MPRSRSISPLSSARSCMGWFARTVPLWRSRPSTRVVLPWSTCAMMAMLRRFTAARHSSAAVRAERMWGVSVSTTVTWSDAPGEAFGEMG